MVRLCITVRSVSYTHLNPTKISGVCGRLMCCLKNEEETYEELNSKLPNIGDYVTTDDGLKGEVHSVSVLRQLVKVVEMCIRDSPMLLDYIKKLQEDNLDLFECLDFMQLWYRDILMFKVTKDINTLVFKDEYGVVSGLCQKSSYEGLETILNSIEKAKARLNANVNTELALELMLLRCV